MYIQLTRFYQDNYQTLGELQVIDNNIILLQAKTLELPWKDNKKNISRIPNGIYPIDKIRHPVLGSCLWLLDVPERTDILIHVGNYKKDIQGCILVGTDHIDIDGDGHKDVINSRKTMTRLYEVLPEKSTIEIIQQWK